MLRHMSVSQQQVNSEKVQQAPFVVQVTDEGWYSSTQLLADLDSVTDNSTALCSTTKGAIAALCILFKHQEWLLVLEVKPSQHKRLGQDACSCSTEATEDICLPRAALLPTVGFRVWRLPIVGCRVNAKFIKHYSP